MFLLLSHLNTKSYEDAYILKCHKTNSMKVIYIECYKNITDTKV